MNQQGYSKKQGEILQSGCFFTAIKYSLLMIIMKHIFVNLMLIPPEKASVVCSLLLLVTNG
jgi:hypothetical protein